MSGRIALGVVSFIFSACIEPSQPRVRFDANQADVTGADVEVDVDLPPMQCSRVSDCPVPGDECQRWDCLDELCVARGIDGGTCDERDKCTIGTCASGRCVKVARLCDSANGCRTPVCDPEGGCDTVPQAGGFCEAPGPSWGQCSGPIMYPSDRCDAAGECAARVAGGTPAPSFESLNGAWVIVRYGLRGAKPSSEVGSLNLNLEPSGMDATASFIASRANGVRVDALLPTVGTWCMAADRGFHVDLPGLGAWNGQLDMVGQAFGAYAFEGNEVVLGIRNDGAPADLSGSYRVFAIHSNVDRPIGAWVGTAQFEEGCLKTATRLQSAPGMADLEFPKGQCVESGPVGTTGGLLSAGWTTGTVASPSFPLHFEGGLSAKGDLFVGAWVDRGNGDEVGLIVAVREGATMATQDSSWFSAFQALRPVPGDMLVEATGQRALVQVRSSKIVNGFGVSGRFAGTGDVPQPTNFYMLDGPFRVVSRDGRFDLGPRTADQTHNWSGTLAARNRLGFLMEVEPWNVDGAELVRPAWPSFGVIVERRDAP